MATTDLAAGPGAPTPANRPHPSAAGLVRTAARLHRPLMVSVAFMAALAVVSAIGMLIDDRQLLGESVWLKPFKFGFAFTLYSATLAFLLSLPHKGSRATWWLGTVFAITGVLDVGFIAVQGARGTFSHFNNVDTDPVNQIGQQIFMSGVPGLFLANLLIALILCWQRLVDRPTASAIRFGLLFAVAGMAMGYLMGFTGKQLVRDADGKVVELIAGHTVIDPALRDLSPRDAAPGMPITHWSTIGGDLRVPHFVGLHGIQVLLLAVLVLAWLAPRYRWLRAERTRAAVIGVLGLGYTGLLAIVFAQAMRAQSLVHPDATTLLAFGGVVAGTGALLGGIYLRRRHTA
ncbi:hypothetical protein [Nocardia brasiliensis]|uniref:Uncharacterized protein n=1 Tax=Nocardia brasiliensis (strain ATCC 700358 / HUJEG-1) TaxID=1133849 RepID=K0ETZ3_NOCB7|nr:hypothetical protein [Nocardia brasiliensis]AFU03233.1 hypothetical protein O3I_026420 [Nocardia brasiliensis ATCC 700358]